MGDMARVTLVFPAKLWEEARRLIPARQRSRVVAEALEAEIRRRKRVGQLERIRQFQAYLYEKYGEAPSGAEEIRQMREERDVQLTGLH